MFKSCHLCGQLFISLGLEEDLKLLAKHFLSDLCVNIDEYKWEPSYYQPTSQVFKI